MEEPATKTCTVCKKKRPIENFYIRRSKGKEIGRISRCKFCASKQAAAYNTKRYREDAAFRDKRRKEEADRHARKVKEDPLYREKLRDRTLMQSYGIGLREFNRLLKKQKGRCAICRYKPDPDDKRKRWRTLEVDHCHLTGRVRGLLCRRCNDALGKFEDDPALLTKALAFIS